MNLTTRLTEVIVSLVQSNSVDPDESAAPEGGSSFADCAMISIHGLRIILEKSQ
jgi:hypothetical protein